MTLPVSGSAAYPISGISMASLGVFLHEEPPDENISFQEPEAMPGLANSVENSDEADEQTAADHSEDIEMGVIEANIRDLGKETHISRRVTQYTSSNAIRAERVRRHSLMAMETEEEEITEEEVDN